MMLDELEKEIEKHKNPEKARLLQGFFKTGKGQYGEGDVFYGLTVPEQRRIAKVFLDISFEDLETLLNDKVHEKRLIALLILVERFKKAFNKNQEDVKKEIFEFYLKNSKQVNNWDLVDLSSGYIVGLYLSGKSKEDRGILCKLARSENLWERRISIVSTFAFIRIGQFEDTLKISEILMDDKHDLIHKAVGWMLREVGKKDQDALETLLKKHYKRMPRTMLRYSIERFPEDLRKRYLKGEV